MVVIASGIKQRAAVADEPRGRRRVRRLVLQPGLPPEPERDPGPDDEVERRAREEEGLVEVGLLEAQERVVGRGVGVAPVVERVQAERHRQEQDGEERQRGGGVLGHAPDQDAPGALHRRVDQHEVEATEGDRQEEQERDQPGRVQPLRVAGAEDHELRHADGRDADADERQPREAVSGGNAQHARAGSGLVAHARSPLTRSATRAGPPRTGAAAPAWRSGRSAGPAPRSR